MPSSNSPREPDDAMDDEPELLNADEVAEEVIDDGDVMMNSDDENEEVELRNDSIAYMDTHKDSVFCIAAHPTRPNVIATGGSEGDEDDAPGKGYITDMGSVPERPVLPASYSADPAATHPGEGTRVEPIFALDGHADSINCVTFTLPAGDAVVTGGLDGKLRSYAVGFHPSTGQPKFKFLDEAQEVPEINFLLPCPNKDVPNTVALGASDGSVWVYRVGKSLEIVQSYFVHAAPVTAGAWTPDGNLLATVDEEGCLYVFDVYGVAAGKEVPLLNGGATVVSLTAADSRFAVEGGLYSVAVEPKSSFLAVGGAGGAVKIISLPKLEAKKGSEGQAGQILASLQVQSDGVETLAFAPEPLTLLAAGSVDGSIAVFDTTRRFAVRRHIVGAHEEFSVVKVEWVKRPQGGEWALTSCGMDGVVRRWDLRATGSTAATGNATVGEGGLIKEWKGHRGDGEKGGVLGFVQNEDGSRVITAGDDGIVLAFEG